MEDEGNAFFDAIFDFFAATVELGESWGEPWGILLPAGVVVFIAVLLIGGLQSVAGSLDKRVQPWLGILLGIGAILVFAALNAERLSDDEPTSNDEVPSTTVDGG